MRRRHINNPMKRTVNINLTPMIDMVFILLIFFIVTTSFVKETGVEINRPSAKTAERKEQGNILVAITQNGEIWIDRRPVEAQSVRANIERLKAQNPEGAVIIQADNNSQTGVLITVIDQIRLAGIVNISLAANKP